MKFPDRRWMVAAALFTAWLVQVTPACALDPRHGVTQYATQAWTTDQGLPQNSARAIAQTTDGYLWIGTEEGLARFDGMRFKVFDLESSPQLRGTVINDLASDRSDGLWILDRAGVITHLVNGRFQSFTAADGAPQCGCAVLHVDRENELWVGSADGLSRFEKGRFVSQTAAIGLPRVKVTAIHQTRDGSLWIGTDEGDLFRWSGRRLVRYSATDGLPARPIYAIREDGAGSLLVATWGAGVWVRQNERFSETSKTDQAQRVYDVAADREGNLWIAASDGLFRHRDGKLDNIVPTPVYSVLLDREGNLWAGTRGGGLMRLSDGRFLTYSKKEGLADDTGTAIVDDVAGDLWVGTLRGGLSRIHGTEVRTFTAKDGLLSDTITALARDAGGGVWVGTDHGLNFIRGDRVSAEALAGNDSIIALASHDGGGVWIATKSGLRLWQGRTLKTYPARDGHYGIELWGLYEGRNGAVWIASETGVTRLAGDRFTTYTAANGLPHEPVLTVHEDQDGVAWAGTLGGGVARLKDGSVATLLPDQGLPTDKVATIVEDDSGNLWMSANKGIFRVAKSDLNAVAEGRRARLTPTSYDKADGMRNSECRAGHPAAARTRDGRLWFLTINGVAAIDPRQLAPRTPPPPVIIEEMKVNQRPVAVEAGLELAPGSNAVEIVYTALGLSAPEKLRFRYRLRGFDREWQNAGTRRTAYYTNLPPGRYRFQVIAGTHEGVWNERGAAFDFRIKPHFYQTTWFLLLIVAAIVAAAFALHRFQIELLRAGNAVLEERNRIAREVHDGVAQGIGAIAMQLEAARGAADEGRGAQHVERARALADQTLIELRRSLSALRPPLLDDLTLPEALERLVEPFAAGTGVDVRVEIRGSESELPTALATDVLRIAQEALHNAVRHAHPKRIDVQLTYEPRRLLLRVTDDGVGFDAQRRSLGRPQGLGLTNIQQRTALLGGNVSVSSQVGEGARVEVSLPIRGTALSTLLSALRPTSSGGVLRGMRPT